MIKVSVCLAIYNVEKYLEQSLESVINQTLKEIEIICVNDGSKDNSLEILEKHALKEPRIKIINKDNGGLYSARNVALKHASGKYICFLDADDYYDLNYCKILFDLSEKNELDIAICGTNSVYQNKKFFPVKKEYYKTFLIPQMLKNKVISINSIKNYLFRFRSTTWCKMYRRLFLLDNNISFQNVRNSEDQRFFIECMVKASKILFTNKYLYYYRRDRPTSLTKLSRKQDTIDVEVLKDIYDLLLNTTYKVNSIAILEHYLIKCISRLAKCNKNFKDEYIKALSPVLENISSTHPGWWKYYRLKSNDSYLKTKLKISFFKIKYLLLE